MELPAPSWRPDPTGRYRERWWDGRRWTDRVRRGEVEAADVMVRPRGAVGSARPAPHTVASLPTGARWPVGVRVLVVAGVTIPVVLLGVTVEQASTWVDGLRDDIAAALCERDPDATGDPACER